MNRLILFFLLTTMTHSAWAQINITCNSASHSAECSTQTGLTSVVSSESWQILRTDGVASDLIKVDLDNLFGDYTSVVRDYSGELDLVMNINNNNLTADYSISIPGAESGGVISNAANLIITGDRFGLLDINLRGYIGRSGRPTTELCNQAVNEGLFGVPSIDDSIIEYTALNNISTCTSELIQKISELTPSNFCPEGYVYYPNLDNSDFFSFYANRRRFKRLCEKTITTTTPPTLRRLYVEGSQSCPQTYYDRGLNQDYPESDSGENVLCTSDSCNEARLVVSEKDWYSSVLKRESGEEGSFGGAATLLIYDAEELTFSFENGQRGMPSPVDLDQPMTSKYCVRIVDNLDPSLPMLSPERKVPEIYLHKVKLRPFYIENPDSLPSLTFPDRSADEALGLYNRVDSSLRDYVFRELIKN